MSGNLWEKIVSKSFKKIVPKGFPLVTYEERCARLMFFQAIELESYTFSSSDARSWSNYFFCFGTGFDWYLSCFLNYRCVLFFAAGLDMLQLLSVYSNQTGRGKLFFSFWAGWTWFILWCLIKRNWILFPFSWSKNKYRQGSRFGNIISLIIWILIMVMALKYSSHWISF